MIAPAPPFGPGAPGADYARDPFPYLARLRDMAPRYHAPERDAWFFSARADIAALLRDDRLGITQGTSFADRSDSFRATVVRRLRGWFSSSGPMLSQTVSTALDDCLAMVAAHGGGDLVPLLAQALPARVMASLLGIPASDLPALQQVSEGLLQGFDLEWEGRPALAAPASQVLALYFQKHWRLAPATELMGLLRATQAEFDLPQASMVDTCSKLFSAGTTTTAAAIANILARLIEAAGVANGSIERPTVEELLRLGTPLLALKRVALTELQIGEAVIRPGQKVYLLVGSAHRTSEGDAAAAPLTFGLGRYHCLGAALARLEIEVMLDPMQKLAARMRLSGPVQWRESWLLHEARSILVKTHGVS